ncbi:MAG: GNAT family N-acetyltransferase [Candidatus Rokuibacteriota bacterium]
MSDLWLLPWSGAPDQADFVEVFAELPGRARRDPYRAGLPPATWWTALLDLPRPREFWIAETGGRAVGRVGASLSLTFPATGYLGFFELDVNDLARDAVAGALLDTARAWLGERGVRTIYGPLDLATWFNYRFRVPAEGSADEEAEASFAWEPVNPPEYARWFAEAGFREAERYCSVGFRIDDPALVDLVVATTGLAHDQARDKGLSFRPLDAARLEAELAVLYALSMEAFGENFLFEPIPLEVFRALYVAGVARLAEPLIHFVLDPQGREAGFVFAFIDRGYAVIKTIAVRPQFRGRKVSTALMHLVFRDAAARGLHRAIAALVKTDSTSAILAARHERVQAWRHEYALYEQCL